VAFRCRSQTSRVRPSRGDGWKEGEPASVTEGRLERTRGNAAGPSRRWNGAFRPEAGAAFVLSGVVLSISRKACRRLKALQGIHLRRRRERELPALLRSPASWPLTGGRGRVFILFRHHQRPRGYRRLPIRSAPAVGKNPGKSACRRAECGFRARSKSDPGQNQVFEVQVRKRGRWSGAPGWRRNALSRAVFSANRKQESMSRGDFGR